LFDYERNCARTVLTDDPWAEPANRIEMVIKTDEARVPDCTSRARRQRPMDCPAGP